MTEGATVSLCPLGLRHAEATYRFLLDPQLAADLGLTSDPSWERTRRWIDSSGDDDTRAAFAILLDDQHVGNVVLDQIDRWVEQARLSIYLGGGAQGRGVGTEAVRLVVQRAFDDLNLNRVWLHVHAENARARRCYLKAGFRDEGLIREGFRLGDELIDAHLLGILRRDLAGPRA